MKRQPLKSLIANTSLALLLMGALTRISWASDDSDLTLSSNNGNTQFAVQNNTANDIFMVNSAGSVLITSNTVMSGTTVYQNGSVNMGVSGSSLTLADFSNIQLGSTNGTKIGTATTQKLSFYGVIPVAQQASGTNLQTALSNYGLYPAGAAIPFAMGNAALSGVTTLSMNAGLSGLTTIAMNGTLTGVSSISMSNLITTYNNTATVGMGVTPVMGTVALAASGVAQSAAAFFTPINGGVYLITVTVDCTTAEAADTISAVTINWHEANASVAETTNILPTTVSLATQGNIGTGTAVIWPNGTAVTYSTTVSITSTGRYRLFLNAVRLQ